MFYPQNTALPRAGGCGCGCGGSKGSRQSMMALEQMRQMQYPGMQPMQQMPSLQQMQQMQQMQPMQQMQQMQQMPPMQQMQPVQQMPSMPNVAGMIVEAVKDERHDEAFYRQLSELAPTKEQKEIIVGVANQERHHQQMFRQLYRQLTGRELPASPAPEVKQPASYRDGLRQAIFGEIEGVEFYRQLHAQFPAGSAYRDVIFEIMTNEANHQTKFLYLYSKDR